MKHTEQINSVAFSQQANYTEWMMKHTEQINSVAFSLQANYTDWASGEAYTEWNYKTKGNDSFQQKSKQPSPKHLSIKTDWKIMEWEEGRGYR
jgi:hypothetical protein